MHNRTFYLYEKSPITDNNHVTTAFHSSLRMGIYIHCVHETVIKVEETTLSLFIC